MAPKIDTTPVVGYFDDRSAYQIRQLQLRVKQTTSLIATQGPIKEEIGPYWAAKIAERTIIWRPTVEGEDRVWSNDELLFLITHEASHLNYTGGFGWPNICGGRPAGDALTTKHPTRLQSQFFRWVNAAEDIRIERLACKEMPGFADIRTPFYQRTFEDAHRKLFAGYGIIEQVWMGYFLIEHGIDMKDYAFKPRALDFVNRTWRYYTRCCNAPSTENLARAIEPLFLALLEVMNARTDDQAAHNLSGAISGGGLDGGSNAGDEPSDNPSRSTGSNAPGDADNPMSNPADVLEGMAQDADGGRTKIQLSKQAADERKRQERAKACVKQSKGSSGGPSSIGAAYVSHADLARWNIARQTLRSEITAISRQFGKVLQNNAADVYGGSYRRGKPNMRRAHRVERGNVNICRRRTEVGKKDYVVGLTVDCSGSMNRDTQGLLDTVVLLSEGLEKAGIGVFIALFNGGLIGIKKVTDRLTDSGTAAWLGGNVRPSGMTYEAGALILADQEFSRYPKAGKFLFGITDGSTARAEESRTVIAEIVAKHRADCINISIQHDVASHWPNGVRVNNVNETITIVTDELRKLVRKGH